MIGYYGPKHVEAFRVLIHKYFFLWKCIGLSVYARQGEERTPVTISNVTAN